MFEDIYDSNQSDEKRRTTNYLGNVGIKRKDGYREEHDFYPTPKKAIEQLLTAEQFTKDVWEPACGKGDISKVLTDNGYNVYSTDIIDREFGDGVVNFLSTSALNIKRENIITNPPYKYSLQFIHQAKQCATNKIAFLLPLNFLEGAKRLPMFRDEIFPLKQVLVFCRRITMTPNGTKAKTTGMIAYAWFIWDKEHGGGATINWII